MHRTPQIIAAIALSALLLPSCRITDKGVDVSMVKDRVLPPEQDQVYVETGNGQGTPAAAPYGYDVATANSYVVQPGDTLSKIAAGHHLTLAELYRANNLTATSVIKVGQRLIIPAHSPAKPVNTHSQHPGSSRIYTVQAGDTLSSIARRQGVSMQTLMQANHLNSSQAARLRIGQTLHIPNQR